MRQIHVFRQILQVHEKYTQSIAPQDDGLPRKSVLLWPLGLLVVVFAAFVALGLTGSSTGTLYSQFESGNDPDLLLNKPLPIRSDEWYVQTAWTISQVEQGLPVINQSFPGGMDATVQHDLPTKDWSTIFRPHLLGFWFLPLDNAMAFKWWFPGFALIAAVYFFAVTLMPRRPVSSALLAVGFYFAPFFQWWYLSITFYPAVWAFTIMGSTIWILRRKNRNLHWLLAGLAAYLTITVGMGIYVPFIVPSAYVTAAFVIGAIFTTILGRPEKYTIRAKALLPLIYAGLFAVVVLGIWIVTRLNTIIGFIGTVYPGQRLTPPGTDSWQQIKTLLSGPFQVNLELGPHGTPFAGNEPEASTFLVPGLFLAITLIWLFIRKTNIGRDWLSFSLLFVGLLFAAYLIIPGWESISHLLLLDRTTPNRLRIGWGLLSLVVMIVIIYRLDLQKNRGEKRPPSSIILSAIYIAIGWLAFLGYSLLSHKEPIAISNSSWLVIGLGIVIVVGLIHYRQVLVISIIFALISINSTAGVNPLYKGVYNLNDTKLMKVMKSLPDSYSKRWIGIGGVLSTAVLVESGLHTYNGFQSSPSKQMWDQIDPNHSKEEVWNRLALIDWEEGKGEPEPKLVQADLVTINFDSCESFAQTNVGWVLSQKPLNQECIEGVTSVVQGPNTFWIYKIIDRT